MSHEPVVVKGNRVPGTSQPMATVRRQLEAALERRARVSDEYKTPVPGLHVAYIREPVTSTFVYEPSICICVRGAKHVALGDTRFVYGEEQYLVTAVGMPTLVTIPDASARQPYASIQVNFDLELARQVIAEMDIQGALTPHSGPSIAVGPLTEELLDVMVRFMRLLDHPRDIPFLSGLLHRELLYRVLVGPIGDRLRQSVQLGSPDQRIARAITWLGEHYTQRLSIRELARLSGMGVSTLHRHFQRLTALSPLQYQKHLRLHEARRLMLTEGLDAGSSAFTVGYESVSQFNREYRRLFGAPPQRDVRALREQGPRAVEGVA